MVDLTQLKYFQVVAEKENITRAAEELHVAQPSLSISIANLEKSIGVPLFERKGRRIILNEYGKTFLERVKKSITELEEGERQVKEMADIISKTIKVGINVITIFPITMQNFFEQYPDTKLHIVRTSRSELVRRLLKGEVDFTVSAAPMVDENIISKPFLTENIVLIVSKKYPLADRGTIRLEEVKEDSFIYRITENGHETDMVQLTNKLCGEAGFAPKYESSVLENGLPHLMMQLVAAGLGISFIPEHVWEEASIKQKQTLAHLHIESPVCQRTYYISYAKGHYLSERARGLLNYFIESCPDIDAIAAPADDA